MPCQVKYQELGLNCPVPTYVPYPRTIAPIYPRRLMKSHFEVYLKIYARFQKFAKTKFRNVLLVVRQTSDEKSRGGALELKLLRANVSGMKFCPTTRWPT